MTPAQKAKRNAKALEKYHALSPAQKAALTAKKREQRLRRKANGYRPKAKAKPKPPSDLQTITRILGDNFFLGSLAEELALIKNTGAALSATIRNGLIEGKQWPTERHARAALVLWLLQGDNAEVLTLTKLRHPHNRPPGNRPLATKLGAMPGLKI